MHMDHFEICILKLIKKLISLKLMDQYIQILFSFFLYGVEYTVKNHKIVTISMAVSKFNKTQSQCPLTGMVEGVW